MQCRTECSLLGKADPTTSTVGTANEPLFATFLSESLSFMVPNYIDPLIQIHLFFGFI